MKVTVLIREAINSFYSNCSFLFIKSIIIVRLKLQRRPLLLVLKQLIVDILELRQWDWLIAARKPHEDDHVDKHQTGE